MTVLTTSALFGLDYSDENTPEPILTMLANCVEKTILLVGTNVELTKTQISVIVSVIDVISMLVIFIYF